jgi:hypothetical protein
LKAEIGNERASFVGDGAALSHSGQLGARRRGLRGKPKWRNLKAEIGGGAGGFG